MIPIEREVLVRAEGDSLLINRNGGLKMELLTGKPIITYMPMDAHITTILNGDWEKYKYYFSNFLQIHHNKRFVQYAYDVMWPEYKCFETYFLPRNVIGTNIVEITNAIKKIIENNFYIITDVNTSIIKNYKFKEKNQPHEIMIKGWDPSSCSLICSDYFESSYSSELCDSSEVSRAILSKEMRFRNRYNGVLLVRTKNDLKYGYNINKVISRLDILLGEENKEYSSGQSLISSIDISKNNVMNLSIKNDGYIIRMGISFWKSFLDVVSIIAGNIYNDYMDEETEELNIPYMESSMQECRDQIVISEKIIFKAIIAKKELNEQQKNSIRDSLTHLKKNLIKFLENMKKDFLKFEYFSKGTDSENAKI